MKLTKIQLTEMNLERNLIFTDKIAEMMNNFYTQQSLKTIHNERILKDVTPTNKFLGQINLYSITKNKYMINLLKELLHNNNPSFKHRKFTIRELKKQKAIMEILDNFYKDAQKSLISLILNNREIKEHIDRLNNIVALYNFTLTKNMHVSKLIKELLYNSKFSSKQRKLYLSELKKHRVVMEMEDNFYKDTQIGLKPKIDLVNIRILKEKLNNTLERDRVIYITKNKDIKKLDNKLLHNKPYTKRRKKFSAELEKHQLKPMVYIQKKTRIREPSRKNKILNFKKILNLKKTKYILNKIEHREGCL
ncbi:MAG: hypothetical protein ATN32_04065 [Candidatus Epulonipiscium fishelsonii]|nr:MAG: hypothetical protein ATN32_04065 [Epulopiscium sp. AS2M-Bin002]